MVCMSRPEAQSPGFLRPRDCFLDGAGVGDCGEIYTRAAHSGSLSDEYVSRTAVHGHILAGLTRVCSHLW